MRKSIRSGLAATVFTAAAFALAACGGTSGNAATSGDAGGQSGVTQGPLDESTKENCLADLEGFTIAFIGSGTPGIWQETNVKDIEDSFAEVGAEVKFVDGENNHSVQVTALNTAISEDSDLVLLSPSQPEDWEEPLQFALELGMPVFLIDGGIDPNNEELYVQRITPDSRKAGVAAATWANDSFAGGADYIIVEGAQAGESESARSAGWNSIIDSSFTKIDVLDTDGTQDDARHAVAAALSETDNGFELVFAETDEAGLGALEAVEAAGLQPGEDVKIVMIGGTKSGLQELAAGKLSFVAEYNPFFGDEVVHNVMETMCAMDVEKTLVVDSLTFDSPESAQEALDAGAGF